MVVHNPKRQEHVFYPLFMFILCQYQLSMTTASNKKHYCSCGTTKGINEVGKIGILARKWTRYMLFFFPLLIFPGLWVSLWTRQYLPAFLAVESAAFIFSQAAYWYRGDGGMERTGKRWMPCIFRSTLQKHG